MKKLETFDSHIEELKKDRKFAQGYDEQKRLLGLAIKIAQYRQKKGFSQKELAYKSGITQQQLSKIEKGENCNIFTFLKVCNALGLMFELRKTA